MSLSYAGNSSLIYVITSGDVTEADFESGVESVCDLASAAAAAGVDLFQIREKSLSARSVFDLTEAVVRAAGGRGMKILVNDRADIAATAGADGVHLTSSSLEAAVVRGKFGDCFVIGVSAHSEDDIVRAKFGGSDFVTFSPIFETESKRGFGPPQGIERLRQAVSRSSGMPVIALGGINLSNAAECLGAGAAGIAGIGLFRKPEELDSVVADLRRL